MKLKPYPIPKNDCNFFVLFMGFFGFLLKARVVVVKTGQFMKLGKVHETGSGQTIFQMQTAHC